MIRLAVRWAGRSGEASTQHFPMVGTPQHHQAGADGARASVARALAGVA